MAEKQNNQAKTLHDLLDIAEKKDWKVDYEEIENSLTSYLELQKYSPAGQDFHVELRLEPNAWTGKAGVAIEALHERIQCFDVSSEAYMWLDSDGHGKNGAPYDMKDVYDDMVACKDMMQELLNEWED